MAVAKIITNIFVTGLGPAAEAGNSFTETEPSEAVSGNKITVSTPLTLNTGNIAISLAYRLWLKAESGTIYVLFSDTSTAVSASNSNIALAEGESDTYALNMSASDGIRIGGSTATAKISYILLGA